MITFVIFALIICCIFFANQNVMLEKGIQANERALAYQVERLESRDRYSSKSEVSDPLLVFYAESGQWSEHFERVMETEDSAEFREKYNPHY